MTKTDYIPELSEFRMVRRAPETPFDFTEDDRNYIGSCLADVQTAFGLKDFAGGSSFSVDFLERRADKILFDPIEVDTFTSTKRSNDECSHHNPHAKLPK